MKDKQALQNKLPEEIINILKTSSIENPDSITSEIKSFNQIKSWDSLSMAIFHSNFENLIEEKLDFSFMEKDLDCYLNIFLAKVSKKKY